MLETLGKSNMISKTDYSFRKPKFGRKIRSEVYLFMLLYIDGSVTKKFLIETLLKMIDSSVRNLGEVEYDKQNWMQHQKTPVRPKSRSEDYLHCVDVDLTSNFSVKLGFFDVLGNFAYHIQFLQGFSH